MLSAVTPAEVNAIDPPAPPDASPEPDERPPAKARKRPRPTERCGWTPEADKWVAHGYETLGPCWTAIAVLLRRETGHLLRPELSIYRTEHLRPLAPNPST
ncbi:hypothetical protein EMIHUDRAFT_235894 [Emiliania huxleyi CCMP1516]|uniref:Uncharacterized protein n=2 Tax=Emiliania huxleyi TaxID=2903 RepID=A0A0D3JV76_EMIH1|nr:hypothetical protein EMIHUDRAFT_235894 [Emiliania huxleyi CCMP1516]EOD27411.1 hypothetical protein EMIHUDRAFT_235894 [Emiliania huxleyi CCMP1516]|eukprot:XP_005779840.1 hypothetical protein EMIHUDRAFT_235894 [Emiliania huxleyi CCMP1516]